MADKEAEALGLTSAEAARRLAEHGYNEVARPRRNPVAEFLRRYWGPMPWLLELAAVLALAVGHATEAVIICVLLTVNAVVGQAQATSSRRAVELLRRDLQARVPTLRDGVWTEVASRELVPGDVVSLPLGTVVPADVRVRSGEAQLDLSTVTGESVPRAARPGGEVPSGGVVAHGAVRAEVLRTGERSSLGRTAALVRDARPRSRQQELMFAIVRYMMYVGCAASAAVAAYALATGRDALAVASIVVTFLMGAVPVALPAVLAIVQAAGAMALSREGVLVTRLDAVEDAASIDVFCFDKTGTITQNRLEVVTVVPLGGAGDAGEKDVLRTTLLACERTGSEAIDAAIVRAAQARGVGEDGARTCSLTPFDPTRRRTEAVVEGPDGERRLVVKGAPRTVAELCGQDGEELEARVRELSERGLRCVAVACGAGEKDLQLVGLLGLLDPPRADAAALVARVRGLGIRCLMLTGDDVAIAREVATDVGMGGRVLRASELRDLDDPGRLRALEGCDGVAEVLPEDKHLVVRLLQEAGHAVGMTGDGVNDAPALRQAELGCAVEGATDVARASAAAVLTRPGLAGIVDALTESRRAHQRMLTWVINKVTKVIEVVALFSLGYVLTGEMPVSLLGMSLLVLANDFATMSIATDNVRDASDPAVWELRPIVAAASALGVLIALEELLVWWLGVGVLGLGAAAAQTLVLYALVVNSQVRILTVRERGHLWESAPSAGMLVVAAVVTAAYTALALLGWAVPAVPPAAVVLVLALCVAGGVVLDFIKVALFRWQGIR